MTAHSLPSPLDVLRFPLAGSRLIEASAGTGKTFTIAMLYVRLVLGHGGELAFSRPLNPPDILVVTFTDAATRELRDRIRARLAQAAAYFQPDGKDEAVDPLLRELRADYPPEQWPDCARKLQLAAEWMDEAAVSTIHSWCNRMLGEHAFDSGSLFNQTLETDQSDVLLEVVRDYWRTFFFPLDARDVLELRESWPSPENFYRSVTALLEYADEIGIDDLPAQIFSAVREEKTRRLTALKAPWPQWCGELRDLLNAAVAQKKADGRKLQARYFDPWLDKLHHWATSDETTLDIGTGWTRLTPQGLRECWKVPEEAPQHPALTAMETLPQQLSELPEPRSQLLRHACRWVSQRFRHEQESRAQMGFQDLLTRLDAALRGDNGERLAQRIRRQFPVAMIDEFQDTDPLQYRIFDTLYRVADNDPQQGLILIGDPKQAIYAFRGADIYTYLRARRDTDGRHYTLGTNFRSTQAMVGAANQVFMQAENRADGAGAFLFRQPDGGNPVPFLPVQANGRDEAWVLDGADAAALTCWTLATDASLSSAEYRQRMAAGCAREMVRLLQLGGQGRAGFAVPGQLLRPVRPGDMAVLVNTGREAMAVRAQLSARGVRSVYLSDRESVFDSPQAGELHCWLAACADPENDRLLRAALATPSLGLSWQALDRLNHDEQEWERRVMQFDRYQRCWQQQGVLPMLRRLMWEFDVPRRLLAADNTRALTDMLHLAELLQQASVHLDGEHALIRYLAEQCQADNPGGDTLKLRLESDADLVKVVTVHKSKGLEYPLVFLPFACAFRAVSHRDVPLKFHDDDGQPRLELIASDEAVQRADHERLGEDLRKFYVALTRARYAMWLGMAPLKELEKSAPGYLLGAGEPLEPAQLAQQLSTWCGADSQIASLPETDDDVYRAERQTPALGQEPPLPDMRSHRWRITSYSGLQLAPEGHYREFREPAAGDVPEVQSAQQETFSEPQASAERLPPLPSGLDMYSFPRGAASGSFLHGLLEWAGKEGFAALAAERPRVEDQVARRCNRQGWTQWIPVLTDWLMALLSQPLALPTQPGSAVSLAGLTQYQVEMEFWFALSQVDTQELDQQVRAATLAGEPRAALMREQLNGMLKGFIDLVFEHQGRYYVLDYKSNWLGADAADYDPPRMASAMLEHRYDLQLALYLFALHRLLKSRLPDYDYDRHVGGALYLFLRGSQAPGGGVYAQRPDRALIEALDRLFSGETEATA
ncbi:exodeoxyribonuclease V subunit beta [Dickeya solani]|uniref:RecBCD enzyme subunit RecB n=2 Tax=Dickeya solani TaxID=1089444 RepID=A0AAV3KEK4_9GAMM|nr:exodeoxyribonuclease V subunit beta [Dickeya solani]ANE77440.1 exodeoxyribonuclease V subunit beta [Dickeya solani IPO 2222]AUC40737.1 Exodeoxyribonuclease V beta chain [Dickeya solani RNS 08.23.3.1.A]AUH07151.1 exodeoxyribonuclease V subunit beta [Dickeya solani D s0432-1]AUH11200.1 exodeoxyribonuclease V subunit beta [Dickeya solani]AYQ48042.1 RecBCD enzyme subunit RecB [Dickeya solani]